MAELRSGTRTLSLTDLAGSALALERIDVSPVQIGGEERADG